MKLLLFAGHQRTKRLKLNFTGAITAAEEYRELTFYTVIFSHFRPMTYLTIPFLKKSGQMKYDKKINFNYNNHILTKKMKKNFCSKK